MTLLEKFHQWLKTEPFNSKERPTLREAQCVFIAEEFAIGFADWCKQEYELEDTSFHNKWRDVNGEYRESKELLEIYKKEVGL
jgi:hypothetical protein